MWHEWNDLDEIAAIPMSTTAVVQRNDAEIYFEIFCTKPASDSLSSKMGTSASGSSFPGKKLDDMEADRPPATISPCKC